MTITRNSARCDACGTEIESRSGHDFVVHMCAVKPAPFMEWVGRDLVEVPGKTTWSFAVDGGRNYLRRVGSGYTDTSVYSE